MKQQEFYAHGKLLLSAEYLVLHGATALATPCKLGQKLKVTYQKKDISTWKSYDNSGEQWFSTEFTLKEVSAGMITPKNREEAILFGLLRNAYKLNPDLATSPEADFETYLSFHRKWGLGSSSTLVSLIAQWASVNPFRL
ncbi:MAG: mevalonate kinase, partial [Flavobacteriaceae bacterium]|nr:mevalonate kinase [Flavobacteriaceae bacterium]